jgi:hypothetical protein
MAVLISFQHCNLAPAARFLIAVPRDLSTILTRMNFRSRLLPGVCLVLVASLRLIAAPPVPAVPPADASGAQLLEFLRQQNKAALDKFVAYVCEVESSTSGVLDKPLTHSYRFERLGENMRVENVGDVRTETGTIRGTTRVVLTNALMAIWMEPGGLRIFLHDSVDETNPAERAHRHLDIPAQPLRFLGMWDNPVLEITPEGTEWSAEPTLHEGRACYLLARASRGADGKMTRTIEFVLDPQAGYHIVEYRSVLDGKRYDFASMQFIWDHEAELFVPRSLLHRREKPRPIELRWTVKRFDPVAPERERFELRSMGIREGSTAAIFDREGKQDSLVYAEEDFVSLERWHELQRQRSLQGDPPDRK